MKLGKYVPTIYVYKILENVNDGTYGRRRLV